MSWIFAEEVSGNAEHCKDMAKHCCDRMDYDLNQTCDIHESRYDCPDALIDFRDGGYGLIIHDGGSSSIVIGFCPWCGSEFSTGDNAVAPTECDENPAK